MPRVRRWMLPLLLTAGCMPAATSPGPRSDERRALRHVIDSMLAAPEVRHARWGVLIVDPDRGDTLYSRDAGKLFVPASNQKILTSAVSLDALGPDHRFRTILTGGPVRGGVLESDLIVIGRGDPSVSDHMAGDAMLPIRTIADALAQRGITRIRGVVAAGGDAFPDQTAGFGWQLEDFEAPYGAVVDELLFNEGFSTLHVFGGRVAGEPTSVRTAPARSFPRVRNLATTVARVGADTVARLDAAKDSVTWDIILTGTIPAGDSAVVDVTHRDPRTAYVAALREALLARGIAVGDSSRGVPAVADTLFVLESPPLSHLLQYFMKPSQNQIGEMLFKGVSLARTDTGSARVARRLFAERLRAWGAEPDGFLVYDGSGLSRRDMVSPETIVRVLDAMRRGPHFQTYFDAFPVAGVDGTLRARMRGTVGEANVRGKTGTLGNVRSLSGYVTTASGQVLLYSILCNNYLVGTDYISRVQDSIAVRVARLRGIAPAQPARLGGSGR
jgi:D-alanyl-D-alanine carboxypeptidase/D-alanyl-D-alanine-endopeptidase (penicillin-binding protein 4)